MVQRTPIAVATAAPFAPTEGVTRPLNPGLGGALQRFQDTALLAGGRVNLISFDAIAQKLANRWTSARPQVEKYIDRLLGAELASASFHLQVSETDVLVCHPDLEEAAAQAACLGYLRQALQQFIGSGLRAPEGVFRVTSISAERIEAVPVMVEKLLQAEARDLLERERAEAVARAIDPFVASHGRAVRVSCGLETLLKLHPTSTIGLRLVRRVWRQADGEALTASDFAGLAGVDILKMDWATAVHGMAQIRELDSLPATLVLPVSYSSLSSQRGRTEVVALLKEARECAGHGLICEISDLEGAPHAALEEVVSIIRPFALFVVGKLTAMRPVRLRELRGVGLRGLAFDCPPHEGDAELVGWTATTVARARQVASSVLIYGAPSERHAARLAAAGATHVTLPGSEARANSAGTTLSRAG